MVGLFRIVIGLLSLSMMLAGCAAVTGVPPTDLSRLDTPTATRQDVEAMLDQPLATWETSIGTTSVYHYDMGLEDWVSRMETRSQQGITYERPTMTSQQAYTTVMLLPLLVPLTIILSHDEMVESQKGILVVAYDAVGYVVEINRGRLPTNDVEQLLAGSGCRGCSLPRADLHGFDLESIDLSNAQMVFANLSETNLSRSNLSGARLSFARLEYADLTEANLSRAILANAYLEAATLAGADLSSASMVRAELQGADLAGANLSAADLTQAKLTNTSLVDANLTNANLTGADLTGANLAASMA